MRSQQHSNRNRELIDPTKPLPYSIECEKSVVSSAIQDPSVIDRVRGLVYDAIYSEPHRRLWEAICELHDNNAPVEAASIVEHLSARGELESVGGVSGVIDCLDFAPTTANVVFYAERVREYSRLRKIQQIVDRVERMLSEPEVKSSKCIGEMLSGIEAVEAKDGSSGFRDIKIAAMDLLHQIEKEREEPELFKGLRTGIPILDQTTGGLKKGQVAVIAARPGMGKTAFALQTLQHNALQDVPGALFSMEMDLSEVTGRSLQHVVGLNTREIIDSGLTKGHARLVKSFARRMPKSTFFVNDSGKMGLADLATATRELVKRHKVEMVAIDYLELMDISEVKNANYSVALGRVANGIKQLARDLGIRILLLVQMNRSADESEIPSMRHIRNSGDIEAAADHIWFPWRPDQQTNNAKIIWGKGRGCPAFVPIYCHFDGDRQTFAQAESQKAAADEERAQQKQNRRIHGF